MGTREKIHWVILIAAVLLIVVGSWALAIYTHPATFQ